MSEKTVATILDTLDAQLNNCIEKGAYFNPARSPYFCISGGNEPQNTFYQGNVNLAEAAIMADRPGAFITVNRAGKHEIKLGRA